MQRTADSTYTITVTDEDLELILPALQRQADWFQDYVLDAEELQRQGIDTGSLDGYRETRDRIRRLISTLVITQIEGR